MRQKSLVFACAIVVYGTRSQFFARTCLALHKHGNIALCSSFDKLVDPLHRITLPKHDRQAGTAFRPVAENIVLSLPTCAYILALTSATPTRFAKACKNV